MRKIIFIFFLIVILFVAIVTVCAVQSEIRQHKFHLESQNELAGDLQVVGNSHCPVSGFKIKKKFFAGHHGKKYSFCCPDCVASFKKDPGKVL
jgi:YHS domain-containing protein